MDVIYETSAQRPYLVHPTSTLQRPADGKFWTSKWRFLVYVLWTSFRKRWSNVYTWSTRRLHYNVPPMVNFRRPNDVFLQKFWGRRFQIIGRAFFCTFISQNLGWPTFSNFVQSKDIVHGLIHIVKIAEKKRTELPFFSQIHFVMLYRSMQIKQKKYLNRIEMYTSRLLSYIYDRCSHDNSLFYQRNVVTQFTYYLLTYSITCHLLIYYL
jgi:hypothetical protein